MVSDTDGSAFITKAEFDSLKNNFQAQIDNYNTSIDSKIDGAIAAYLAGIKQSTETTEDTFLNKLNTACQITFLNKQTTARGSEQSGSGLYGAVNFSGYVHVPSSGYTDSNWLQAWTGGSRAGDCHMNEVNAILFQTIGSNRFLDSFRNSQSWKSTYMAGIYTNGSTWTTNGMNFYFRCEYKKENRAFKLTGECWIPSGTSPSFTFWGYTFPQTWNSGSLSTDYKKSLLVGYQQSSDKKYPVTSTSGELELNGTAASAELWGSGSMSTSGNKFSVGYYYSGSWYSGYNGTYLIPKFVDADLKQEGDFYSLPIYNMVGESKKVHQGCPIVKIPKKTTVHLDFKITTTSKVFFRDSEFPNDAAPSGNVAVSVDDESLSSTSVAPTISSGTTHKITLKNDTSNDFTLWIKPETASNIISKQARIVMEN